MTSPFTPLLHQLQSGDVLLALVLVLLPSWTVYTFLRITGLITRSAARDRLSRVACEIGILLGLEQAYEFTRGQIPYTTDVALLHAYNILDFEWRHGFFVESRLERFFLQFPFLMNTIDLFYVFAHLVVTVSIVLWICLRHKNQYPFVRNLLILTTGIALIVFYVYPTAPPRMLPNYGFVDPLQLHHFASEGGAQPGSYTYNPYAAMPSLHVAYALIVAWSLLLVERRRSIRLLACAYPIAMAATVVISGNHWLLDVLGAFLTVGLAGGILIVMSRLQVILHPGVLRVAEGAS